MLRAAYVAAAAAAVSASGGFSLQPVPPLQVARTGAEAFVYETGCLARLWNTCGHCSELHVHALVSGFLGQTFRCEIVIWGRDESARPSAAAAWPLLRPLHERNCVWIGGSLELKPFSARGFVAHALWHVGSQGGALRCIPGEGGGGGFYCRGVRLPADLLLPSEPMHSLGTHAAVLWLTETADCQAAASHIRPRFQAYFCDHKGCCPCKAFTAPRLCALDCTSSVILSPAASARVLRCRWPAGVHTGVPIPGHGPGLHRHHLTRRRGLRRRLSLQRPGHLHHRCRRSGTP